TMVHHNGQVVKKIPWSAFQLIDRDWEWVKDVRDILKDSCALQHCFSSEQLLILWCALPAIEALQTAWEAKCNNPHFAIYYNVISKGLTKLQKYYSNLRYIALKSFAFLFHSYYKLEYIKMVWGDVEEQAAEIQIGVI
ncbi:hypothetical protein BGY98DRAFT_917109, partial [Russula aff. rugulosa BPL654]